MSVPALASAAYGTLSFVDRRIAGVGAPRNDSSRAVALERRRHARSVCPAECARPISHRRSANTVLPDQYVGGDAESVVELPDHLDRERATAIEHFGDTSTTAEERFEIPASQPSAVHVVEQRIDWVRRLNRLVSRLVVVHESSEDFESVAGGRSCLRLDQARVLHKCGSYVYLQFAVRWPRG